MKTNYSHYAAYVFSLAMISGCAKVSTSSLTSGLSSQSDGVNYNITCTAETSYVFTLSSISNLGSDFSGNASANSASITASNCPNMALGTQMSSVDMPKVTRVGSVLKINDGLSAQDVLSIMGSTLSGKTIESCDNGLMTFSGFTSGSINTGNKTISVKFTMNRSDAACRI